MRPARRRRMRVVNRTNLLALCVVTILVIIGCGKKEKPKSRVFFSEPKDGAEIKAPVKVVMVVEGMEVKPAGEVVEGTGHHHVLSLIHISEPTRLLSISYAVFCLKK